MRTIEELRRELGWTRQELGRRVGVSRIAVYNWERGEKLPSATTLRALAKVFHVCMDDIDFERPMIQRGSRVAEQPTADLSQPENAGT